MSLSASGRTHLDGEPDAALPHLLGEDFAERALIGDILDEDRAGLPAPRGTQQVVDLFPHRPVAALAVEHEDLAATATRRLERLPGQHDGGIRRIVLRADRRIDPDRHIE
jgi:hypothetical protein